MYTINFTTETALFIPPIAFYIALYLERDHTKPHQVWHDTLAPTQRPNGPTNVPKGVALTNVQCTTLACACLRNELCFPLSRRS